MQAVFMGRESIVDTNYSYDTEQYKLKLYDQSLGQVTVTAEYAPSPSKSSVYDVDVIDRALIDKKAAVNLRDVLISETTTLIQQDNVLGAGMNQQGLGGENVKILIDGIPVTGRLNGQVDLSQINMNNVDRVEVVQGPMTVMYGSNALGGVVNVITKNEQKDFIQGSINGYYEHVGQYNADAYIGIKRGKSFTQVSGGRYFFDGCNFPDSSRFQQWKPKEQYFAEISHTLKNKRLDWRVKGNFFKEILTNRGQLRSPYYVTAFDDIYKTTRYSVMSDMGIQIDRNKRFQIRAGYNYYSRSKNNYYKDMTNLESTVTSIENQDTSIFTEINARAVYSLFDEQKKVNYQAGIEWMNENGKGKRLGGVKRNIADYAFFCSLDFKPNAKWILRPSVRISYNTKFRTPVVPSVNIRYKPLSSLALRASYTRGFRAPSLKELYFDFVDINHDIQGNENLKAETSHNLQFSANYFPQFSKWNLDIECKAYYNDVRNLIRLGWKEGASYSYVNIQNSKTIGFSTEALSTYKGVMIKAGVSVAGISSDFGNGVNTSGFQWVPTASVQVSYKEPKSKLEFNSVYKYVGKQPGVFITNTEDVRSLWIQDYHLLDVSVSREFVKGLIRLQIGGKNLSNVRNVQAGGSSNATGMHNTDVSSMPVGWGASFFAALRISLNAETTHVKNIRRDEL